MKEKTITALRCMFDQARNHTNENHIQEAM